VFLAVAVLGGLLLRIAWARSHSTIIEQEGAEYARIAQNLLAGRGYVGIFEHGPALAFPPLYPLLIAGVSVLTGSTGTAAQWLNLAFGALLVAPVFRLAEEWYGGRVAMLAGALVIGHPALLSGASSTNPEGIHLTLLMAGLLWLWRWLAHRRTGDGLAAGTLLGLAYLVRPEAMAILLVSGLWGLLAAQRTGGVRSWRPLLALALPFFILLLPYAIFLSNATGHFRVETMATVAYEWALPREAGQSQVEAAAAIGPDLSDRGVDMRPNVELLNTSDISILRFLRIVGREVRALIPMAQRSLVEGTALGSPLLVGLIVLGLWRTGWTRERGRNESWLLLVLLLLLVGQALIFRNFYALLGILLLWAAKGADELGEWARVSAVAISGRPWPGLMGERAMAWGSIGLLLLIAGYGVRSSVQSGPADLPLASAGEWLSRHTPRPVRIMDAGSQVAYYAGASLTLLPYTDNEHAIGYIRRAAPDFIVLTSRSAADRPYTSSWLTDGIPDPNAVQVFDSGAAQGQRVRIFRWSSPPPQRPPDGSVPRPVP
jgi:hypothetical protein